LLRGIVQVPEGRRLFPDMTVLENSPAWLDASSRARAARRGLDHVHALFPILRERGGQLAGTLSEGAADARPSPVG